MAAKYSSLRSVALGCLRILRLTVRRLHIDVGPGLELFLSVGDHFVASLQARLDHYDIPLRQGDLYRLHLHRVVGIDDIGEGPLRTALYRARGHGERVLAALQEQVNVYKLIGPQTVVRILEDRL